ncbi:MAG: TIGR00269 family protein [Candidatus Anstonellales archaeon]
MVAECSRCGKRAIINLLYTGQSLCERHFTGYFEKRVFSTIREHSMIRKGDIVAVGVSGGKDSSVMLYILKKLTKKMPFEVVALCIDEGIKGYRDKSIAELRKLCRRIGVTLKIIKASSFAETVDQRYKEACSYCGVVRRYLLNKGAKEIGATKIAIGHNLDDVVQTLMLNLTRNEPDRAVRFFYPSVSDEGFIPRIRPLMNIPEREVAIYALVKGIECHLAECPYSYLGMRKYIREELNRLEEKFPGTKLRMARSFESIAERMKPTEHSSISKCKKCGEPTNNELCMFCKMTKTLNSKAASSGRASSSKCAQAGLKGTGLRRR